MFFHYKKIENCRKEQITKMRDEINTISWLKRKLKNDDNSQQEKKK